MMAYTRKKKPADFYKNVWVTQTLGHFDTWSSDIDEIPDDVMITPAKPHSVEAFIEEANSWAWVKLSPEQAKRELQAARTSMKSFT